MFEAEVGKAIAKLRGSRTRREVAKKAGIHSTAWSAHERGRRQPRRKTLQKILKGLGCTPEQFEEEVCRQLADRLAAKAPKPPAPGAGKPSTQGEATEHEQAMAHHFTAFSALLQEEFVARLVKALHPDSSD